MPGANFDPHTAQLHQLQQRTQQDDDEMDITQGTVRDRVQVMDSTTGLPMTSRQIAQATDATNQTGAASTATGASAAAHKKKGQTLFGPDVGFEEADAVGGWTKDETAAPGNGTGTGTGTTPTVPLGVVKSWMERAREIETDTHNAAARVHKTTTLQAMVNLKRPSLALIALTPHAAAAAAAAAEAEDSHASTRHALRFSYDASSPSVQITISIHPRAYPFLPTQRPIRTLYSAPHPGGFAKTWQLPQEGAIDLATLMEDEARVKAASERAREEEEERRRQSAAFEDDEEEEDLKKGRHAHRHHSHVTPASTNTPAAPAMVDSTPARSRFGISGILGRRQRRQDEEQGIVAGIRNSQSGTRQGEAIEMQPTTTTTTTTTTGAAILDPARPAGAADKEKDVMEEDGIRLLIRLDALDAQGNRVSPANAQLTHVLLTGTAITSASTPDVTGPPQTTTTDDAGISPVPEPAHESTNAPVKRTWALKVVRREAIIASHTFLLKEIYGLSAASAETEETSVHHDAQPDLYGNTPNECIVCLTNARDVVLLPCRHLVVCRECALGMIEFGAGGKVARREETTTTAAAASGSAGDAAVAAGTPMGEVVEPVVAPAPAPTTRERRKRKAKGWFCPVCRQPYTSLLRLALPAPANQAGDTVQLEETADENADTATIRSFRTTRTARSAAVHSLHRVSSRATLPERGERMLRDLAPDSEDDEDEDEDDREHARPVMRDQAASQAQAHASPSYPPQMAESEGERRERLQQEEMDREATQRSNAAPFVLGEEVDIHTPPAAHTREPLNAQGERN
ncbi:hypothetical protein NCC49_005029 [Naganishia albida]|nr:hypothetical protein NCC49_005029 [Naganishia albida]